MALALPALLFVLAGAVTVQTVLAAHATCADAARAAARAAARGDSDTVVRESAQRISSRIVDIRISRESALVRVEVIARPPAIAARIPVPLVTADAVAAAEDVS